MNTFGLGRAVLAGLFATMTMDIGSLAIRKTGFTAGLPPNLMGRWFASLARGQLGGQRILESAPVANEVPLALATHYLIGIVLGLAFLGLVTITPLRGKPDATFLAALLFGVLSSALAWLWMFPAMGLGRFGLAGPPELLLLRTSLVNHVIYGLGLAIFTRWLGAAQYPQW